jgi:hypothetical protein
MNDGVESQRIVPGGRPSRTKEVSGGSVNRQVHPHEFGVHTNDMAKVISATYDEMTTGIRKFAEISDGETWSAADIKEPPLIFLSGGRNCDHT